jgi:hypothetical protein
MTSNLSLSEKRRKAARARWGKPGSRERQSQCFKGREITWSSKISKSIQALYTDPNYLAKKARNVLSPLERALRVRLKMYRFNGKKDGNCWELSNEAARALFVSSCHYCEHAPDFSKLNGIDRLDNAIGYTAENSVSCCWVCNRNKGTLSYSDFVNWVCKVHRIVSSRSSVI